ncbi:MAG: CidA/LrgA family protein [Pseudomonadota bacterium]
MLFHLTVIFGCQLAGETLTRLFALPLPGPVLGMAILFVGLLVFGLPEPFRRTGEVLISNLSLLFVPAGVGVMLHGALISADWLPIAVGLVGSTLITIAVTAHVMQRMGGSDEGSEEGNDEGSDGGGGAAGGASGGQGREGPENAGGR